MFSSINKLPFIQNYFTLLIALIPVSFIAGNLVINLNVFVIIVSSLLIFGKEIAKIKLILLDKLIFLFFFFILFSALYNDIYFIANDLYPEDFKTIKKSFLFLRYLFLYFSIRFLIEKNIINLKFFFLSCFFSTLFVSLDIFYQFIFGKDIFGFVPKTRKFSGPFNDELIAGGYLLRFSIFSFFLIPIFYRKYYNKIFLYLLPILLILFLIGMILAGNRMPFIMYIFTLSLITIFHQALRKYFLILATVVLIIFSLLYKGNTTVKGNFDNFYSQLSRIIVLTYNRDFEVINPPTYFKEFYSFYDTWLSNKYIGGGIKNFWYYCHIEQTKKTKTLKVCNTHPHNYYLEILTELGLVGLMLVLPIIIIILYQTFYKKYFTNSSLKNNNLITPFIFLFISELFPLKGTGSFFTTNNATYLFFIIAILIGLNRNNNFIENKK